MNSCVSREPHESHESHESYKPYKPHFLCVLCVLCLLCVYSCDSGDIIETKPTIATSGKYAHLRANVTGMSSWSAQYNVVLAGFAEDNDLAVVQKQLPEGSDGEVELDLLLNSDQLSTIELCVTNRLRQRIVSYASVSVADMVRDTLYLDAGEVNLGMYQAIQDQIFTNTCARCHGLSESPAGRLSLAEGRSYANLVNHAANHAEDGVRVVPGDADASLLYRVITGDDGIAVSFNHSNMLKEDYKTKLIGNWITGGAKE